MLSVQVTAPGCVRLGHVPEPEAAGQALVKVHRVGICGTDLKILSGGIPVDYPRIMGHEMVGEVVHPSPDGLIRAGQRVLVDPAISCGHCDLCRAGRPNLCSNGGLVGRDVDGFFASYVAAPEARILSVPESISDAASGLLQVLGTCIHALRSVAVLPGDVVVVIGLGTSGLMFVQLLTAMGATVIGVTRTPWKLDMAARFGAAASATPAEAETVVRRQSKGRGAQVVIEAAGSEETLSQAIELAATGGAVVVFGTIADRGHTAAGHRGLPYYQMYLKELAVHNPRAALQTDYQRGIDLVASGALQLQPLVTHHLGLADVEEAFAAVRGPLSLKVLMEVGL